MFVHEYQAKDLLKQHGFSFPEGGVAYSAQDAGVLADRMTGQDRVIKAQILAGDRGRFGGIRMAKSAAEVVKESKALLGSTLVTPQTGEQGIRVDAVYIEQAAGIQSELYLAILLDRYQRELVLLASRRGGTGIESVLENEPETLHRHPLSVDREPEENALLALADGMQLHGDLISQYVDICRRLHDAVTALDALSIELNPLAVVDGDRLVALDVKMEIDDNALFRHPEYAEIRERNRLHDRKLRAQSGYNYVRLDGDIGLLVGGAGLALATMDLLKLHGLEPANFLDLPPIATRLNVADACRTVLESPAIKVLFVNAVGGGLTHCDTIAEGLITAYKQEKIHCPIVARFAGTKREHGLTLLRNSRIPIQYAENMDEAVELLLRATGSVVG